MSITTYQIQNILRSYGKQLGRGRKTPANPASKPEAAAEPDRVEVSTDARRRQVIAKIAQEIINQITTQPQSQTALEQQALRLLSREYGRHLEVFRQPDGSLQFSVAGSGGAAQNLSAEENQRLTERLAAITVQIVDQNMVS